LKEAFPNIEGSIRKDKEGFTIVKIAFRPKYKYNLEAIEKFDPSKIGRED